MNKIRLFTLWFFLLAGFSLQMSCSGGGGEDFPDFQESDVLSFSILGYDSESQIDVINKNIWLQLPTVQKSGRGLIPLFTLSEGATASVRGEIQVSGVSSVNFNTMVTYKVKAANGSSSDWKVTVTNNDYTVNWGLGCFLAEERSNNGIRTDGYYRAQENTGTYSANNCGPAVATMAAMWADNSFEGIVEDARNAIPRGQDGTLNWYPSDISTYLLSNRISCKQDLLPLPSVPQVQLREQFAEQIKKYLDENKLVVLCLKMSFITYDLKQDLEWRVNKYYDGQFGHFILLKGYKVVDGRMFFEVHDPWGLGKKYNDGTYKGANRYYLSDELSKTSEHNKNAVIVSSVN